MDRVCMFEVDGDVRRLFPRSELSRQDRIELRQSYHRHYYHRPGMQAKYRESRLRYYHQGPGKKTISLGQRRRKYGLTEADFDVLLASQGGLCAMECGKPAIHVDHCHETGKVRGLLCRGCNVGLGFYEKLHERAKAYLERTK